MQICNRQKVGSHFFIVDYLKIKILFLKRLKRIEDRIRKEKQKREEQHAQRKAERADKYDAIRMKYGLKSGNEYAKMEDNK